MEEREERRPGERPLHMHRPEGGPGGFPPHLILRELMELKEKVGKLEGMMEVLLRKNS